MAMAARGRLGSGKQTTYRELGLFEWPITQHRIMSKKSAQGCCSKSPSAGSSRLCFNTTGCATSKSTSARILDIRRGASGGWPAAVENGTANHVPTRGESIAYSPDTAWRGCGPPAMLTLQPAALSYPAYVKFYKALLHDFDLSRIDWNKKGR